jgi:hypothetical protein
MLRGRGRLLLRGLGLLLRLLLLGLWGLLL